MNDSDAFNKGYICCICNLLFGQRGTNEAEELMNANGWFTEPELIRMGLSDFDIDKLKQYNLILKPQTIDPA